MTQRTNLTRLTIASLFAAPLAAGATNTGQVATTSVPNPVSAQVGVGLLPSSSAKNATTNSGIHAGLSVRMQNKSLLSPYVGEPSIDLDYNHNGGHGNHIDVFGISYDERVPLSPPNATPTLGEKNSCTVPYVGLGIGAFHNDVSKTTTTTVIVGSTPTTVTTRKSKNGWNFGGKIIAGVDFGQTFVEAAYDISGSTNGLRTDSVNFALGVHF